MEQRRGKLGVGGGKEWNYRAAARQTTRHKYQRVTPIFTRRRVHFLVAAKILKRCDVTDYKTFDTSAKAAKQKLPPDEAGRQADEQQPRQAGQAGQGRQATCHTTLQSRELATVRAKVKAKATAKAKRCCLYAAEEPAWSRVWVWSGLGSACE